MQTRKHYITGLKGISCVFIMLGHFLGIYKYAEQFLPASSLLDTIYSSRLAFFVNEAFWLYLFFYLSGYLIAKSQVKSIKDVVVKSITRFFRFAFPILFSCLVIYLLYISFGFHNTSTSSLFSCSWFQSYYVGQYSIIDVLRSPIDVLFKGNCALNGPYWVLKDMFFASLFIYILTFIHNILSAKRPAISFALLVAVALASISYSNIVFACLLGMLISLCEDAAEFCKKPFYAIGILLVSLSQYLISDSNVFNIFFVLLIILTPGSRPLDAFLSAKPFRFLGDVSWGIYSFHWPLICSAGSLLIIALQPKTGLLASYAIACAVVGILTLVISIIFRFTFERLSACLTSAIDSLLKRIAPVRS